METESGRIRVIVAKVGLDGHDRGVKIVARTLRDAGMDVIYTGLHRTPEEVVDAAIQEDVDVIGISSLATDHLIVPKLVSALRAAGLDDVEVIVGGIIPDREEAALLEVGVARVFHPGSPLEEIIDVVCRLTAKRRNKPVPSLKDTP